MARKWANRAIIAYVVFGFAMYAYLFLFAGGTVPQEYMGTASDPKMFLTEREQLVAEEYSSIRNLLFFLSTPYEWLMYLLILLSGASRAFERWAKSVTRFRFLQTVTYVFILNVATFLIVFPLAYISHLLSKSYGISIETFSQWMRDEVVDFWVNFAVMAVVIHFLFLLIQKARQRWWLYASLSLIPLVLFLMFLQPVVIDPLYNDFTEIQDEDLEEQILQLAKEADIPTDQVFEVNMSEETNALNAYVTGIGSNARIVLWDTTLKQLSDRAILFIMAHEMGHYVEKHLYIGMASYMVAAFAIFFVLAKWMQRIVSRHGKVLKVDSVTQLRVLPLFYLLLSLLLFIMSPFANAVSRYQEARADDYALEMTQDPDAAIEAFQELTRAGRSEVNPPLLVKWFRYGHPTMFERLNAIEKFRGQ
ncbi:M48 family metallopeptidase [Bacillus fonticola]|uniref:M48 family metallopeptidase n=1 Tax=Bacillus fonticola TaxID=2728853 RepID=UPI001D14BB41|nr:M48 family metallopeptidase [Bacillus fonticola]